MAGETETPRMDRHTQVEFGRFVRDRLEAHHETDLPSDLDALMGVLRLVTHDDDDGQDDRR